MFLQRKKNFENLYQRNREAILYLFFGGLTFLISVISYGLFTEAVKMNELIANVFSWILAVLFAYVTNRRWVFDSKVETSAGVMKEMFAFFAGRIVTLVIEEMILFIFISNMELHSLIVKVVAQIVVILLNYFISKIFIFKKKTE